MDATILRVNRGEKNIKRRLRRRELNEPRAWREKAKTAGHCWPAVSLSFFNLSYGSRDMTAASALMKP